MKTKRPSKKLEAKREAALIALVKRYGGADAERYGTGYRYRFDTPVGPWYVSIYPTWVATRFDYSETAAIVTGQRGFCNGKWNIHYSDDASIDTVATELEYRIKRALSAVLDDAGRKTMEREIAEQARIDDHWRQVFIVRDRADKDGLMWGLVTKTGGYLQPDGSWQHDKYETARRFATEAEAQAIGTGTPFKVI